MTSSKKMKEKAKQNLSHGKGPRLFADEVIVLTTVKTHVRKEKKKEKVEKEGLITFAFIDAINNQPVTKVSVLPSTAESLANTLKDVSLKLREEIAKKERVKEDKEKIIESDYIR